MQLRGDSARQRIVACGDLHFAREEQISLGITDAESLRVGSEWLESCELHMGDIVYFASLGIISLRLNPRTTNFFNSHSSLEAIMIRSMILTVALAGAVGCAAQDAQDDQTASVEQHTGGGGFNCSNKASISGVQCVVASLGVNLLNIDVKNVGVLDDSKLNILSNDLNDLDIDVGDINILNGNSILSDLVDVTKNDFLNKFNIIVAKNDVCAVVSVLGLGLCK